MSFILDALKKSEAARQRQAAPGLLEPDFAPPRRGLPVWAGALLVLLGINLIVLSIILIWHATRAPESLAALAGAHTAKLAAAAMPSAPTATTAPALVPTPAAKPFSPMDDAPVDAPEIPAGSAANAVAASPQPAQVAPARAAADDDEEILPTLDALNLHGADALPRLHLDVHVYATNPADRFVFINSHKYTEGSKLEEGPTVERIRRDGVALRYHGIRFLLPRR